MDSRNCTLVVVATSGLQELQGCSDSGRQGPEQIVSGDVRGRVHVYQVQQWPGGVLSVTLPVLWLPHLPFCLLVLSAL